MPEEEVKLGDYRGFLKSLSVDSEGNYVELPTPSFSIATDITPAPEAKYDQGLNLYTEDVDALRRSNQSSWDVVENAFQNAGATALMEIPEGIGYIGTGVANLFGSAWQEDSNGFIDTQNALSTWARETKESMIESNPIYAREEDQNFDPFNAMSWATNAASIGSTISLLIPGMGIGRGAAFLASKAASRLVGLSKIGKASAKVTGAIRTAEQVAAATKAELQASKIVGKAGSIAGTTAATLSSRHAENMLEGFGTYDQSLTESLMENHDMSYDQAKAQSAFLLANPESALNSEYKEDYLKAADAAAKTTTWNWAAGTLDYAQYAMAFGGLNKLFKVGGAATKGVNKASKLANYAKKGWNSSRKLVFQAGTEAAEETYQAIVSKEALRGAEMFEEGFSERFDEYLADEELQSAAMMGAVMGGGFHTMGSVFNKASGKLNDKLLQYETMGKLKKKDGAIGVMNFGLGSIIQRDISLNGNLDNVVKSLNKFSKSQEPTDEFTQTVEMINGLNEQVKQMSSEVDKKGNAAYTPTQLADMATYSFIAQKAQQDSKTTNTEIDKIYQDLEKQNGINSENISNHRNHIELSAITQFLGAKKGKPNAAEQKFLDNLKERKLELEKLIKEEGIEFEPTRKDGDLVNKQFTSLNQKMISESYRDKASKLQTAKGFEEHEVVKAQMQEDAKARQKEGTVAGYSDRTQKATTVEEVEAIEKEEEEQIGDNTNTDRTTTTALLTEMPKVKAILESKELSPEDRIKNLATLLRGNAAAHHKAMSEFGGNLDLTLNKDPQEAAKELVKAYDELQAPNNPDPKKDVFNSILNQKLSEEVGQEVEEAPDVNTRETNTSTFDSNAVTIETSTDESFVGNLLHLAGPGGVVERGDDGTPLNNRFYDLQTKGDKSIDKHLDPKFKIDGARVSYVIDGTDKYNQGDRDGSKRTYRIEMFVNVNGEEIFIGVIPANVAPELREAIESEYEASEAKNEGTRFTSKEEGQVKSKLPGRILNLPDGKVADLNTILKKYPDVKLITTVVTNGTVTLAGLEKAGLLTSDIVITNPENLAAAGKNKEGQPILKGGYVYALVPAPDGRYFPVRLFTKKVGEVESLKNKVSGLVDGLYDNNPEVAEDALSQLKDLIHINRDKSNFTIKLKGGSVLVNGQKAKREKLKENLLSTKQGEGAIAFIDKAKMNSGNYNTDVAEYLNHNMDVSVGIHSPSYKVNAQFTAPVKQPSGRSKETVVDNTATKAAPVEEAKPAFSDNRVPLKEETFTITDDEGGTIVVKVKTMMDGSLKAESEKFDQDGNSIEFTADENLGDNDIIIRDGITAEQAVKNKSQGDVVEKTGERSGDDFMNPKMLESLTNEQRERLGLTTPVTEAAPTQKVSDVEGQGQSLLSLVSAEDITNADIDSDALDISDDSNKPSVISEEEVNSAEDVEDEINFISNVLGGDALVQTYVDEGELVGDIPTVAGLVQQVKSKGQVLEGLFTEAGIYLRTKGTKGRGYHEAFHAVFTLGLTSTQREQVLEDARKRYNDTTSTDLEIEEKLAEEFRVLMISNKALSGLSGALKRFMYALKDAINHLFNRTSPLNVDRLFGDIEIGKFRNKIQFKKEFKVFKPMASEVKSEGISNAHVKEYKDLYRHLAGKVLATVKAQPGYEGLSNAQALRKASTNRRGDVVLFLNDTIFNHMIKVRNNSTDEAYKAEINNFLLNYFSFEKVDGKLVTSKKGKMSAMLADSIFSLRDYGIVINPNIQEIVTLEDNVDIEEAFEGAEEAEEKDNFFRSRMEEDNRQRIPSTVRTKLHTIPKLDKEGNKTYSPIMGTVQYYDGEAVISALESSISNSHSVEHMMDKLKKLKQPWVPQLLELAKEKEIQSTLWTGIGDNQFIKYFGVDNKGRIYLANRKTLKTIVTDNLASAYTVDSNPYLKNEAKGGDAFEEFKEIRKEIIEFSKNDASDETLSPILDRLAGLLERSFIPLNREGLDALMNFPSLSQDLKSKATNFNARTLTHLNAIYADMSEGRNPFTNSNNEFTLKKFAKDYAEISDLKVQPVFFGANKKPKYSLVESNYLSKLITLIQKNPEEFKNNVKGYLAYMPIMDNLEDIDLYLLENTATEKSGKRSYLDISPEELNRANMNAFFNNKFKEDMGLFPIPIPSDSKMLYYLQLPKLTTERAVAKLAQVAIAEQRRIDEFAHENNSGVRKISNIEKNRENFQYFPFLNNVKFKITQENELQIKNAIRNYLEEEYETFVSKLKGFGQTDRISDGREVWESREKEGLTPESFTEFAKTESNTGGLIKLANGESIRIVSKDKLILTGQEVKEFNVSEFTDLESLKKSKFIPSGEAAKEYFYNAFYYNTQITELVHKSPAYYKGVADFFKRVKQGNTPGTSPAESITAKVKVKADVLVENSKEEKAALKKSGKKDKTTQALIANAENNTTDGATFISMAKYKEYMEAIQQWDADKDAAYNKYIKAAKNWKPGTAFKNPLTAKQNQDLFKGFKPFMFTEREVKNDEGISIGTSSPVQLKNSIQVLTPELVVLGGNAGNLAEAYNEMYVNEEKADLIAFSSAVKVGNPGVDQIMEVNLKDMLLAQNTPSHWYEHVARIGSQMRNHMMNNIALEADYNVGGTKVKGDKLSILLSQLTEANLKEDSDGLTSIVNNSEEDYRELRQEIVEVLTNRGAPTAIINSINNSIEVSDKEIIPKLYSSYGSKEAESVVAALFKSRVFKQKLPGGQFVNFTSYGLSDNLEYKVNEETNTLTMEAYLPAWSKDLLDLPVKEDGTIDMSRVDPEVLKLVGFRTPTESKYSIVAIEVKGFLPANLGGNIVLPKGITSRTGLDFDIDKMFVFTPHNTTTYKDTEQKEINKVVVDESFDIDLGPNQSRKARENGLISIYYAISSNLESHGEESIGPGHFENLKDAAYTAYLKNNVSNYKAESAGALAGRSIEAKGEIIEAEEAKKYNIANPLTHLEFYDRVQSGGNLIGVLVNHLINNIKTKFTEVELKDPITINGQEYKSLSSNNMDIDYRLQEFATAIVDNTKEPLAAFINLNINTADAYMAAIRLGLPIDYTVALFSTPLARKLHRSSLLTGKPFLVEAQKALTELQNKREEESESSGGYTNLNLKDLFNSDLQVNFTFKNNISTEKEELLNTFIKLSEVGADLSTVIRGTKLDASAAATSAAGVMLQNKMVEKVTEDNFTSIQGTGGFFSEDGILKMYKENAHDPVREAYAKFFPYFNKSFEGLVTKFLETVPADAFLNDRVISNMFKHAETYHIANHEGLKIFSTEEVMKEVHKAFIKFKTDYAASYPTLISALRLETQQVDPSLEEDRIVVNRSAISKDQINLAHEEWKAMMNNEETERLARNLLAYALKTTGYTPSPFSMMNLIHPDAFNETFGTEESIEERLESLLNNVDVPFDDFISLYVRNVFKEDNSFLLKADKAAEEKDGALVIKKVNGEVPSHYKNTIGNAVDFLIKRDKEGDKLFALDEASDGEITYIEVSSLGTKFYRQDYTPTEESLESPIPTEKSNQKTLSEFELAEKGGEPSVEDLAETGTGTTDLFNKLPTEEKSEVAKKTTFEEYSEQTKLSATQAQAFEQAEWDSYTAEEQEDITNYINNCNFG